MSVSLHTAAHPATSCDAVFAPWLKGVGELAWRERRTVAVVVPWRSHAYWLKARALSAGVPLLGVHFITPGELRDRLARGLGAKARVPLREHLHLLLAAAERCGDAGVATDPDVLLKAIDLLSAGGWSFAEAGPAGLRAVVAEFERLVKLAGFQLMHDADRALLALARRSEPAFGALLITGFDAAHWPMWPLLAAAAHSASHATVCLSEPRAESHSLDATWIGTWEQEFGESAPVPDDAPAKAAAFEFLVGRNTSGQARAVVAKALQFLADPACERLGILFPAAGALSRRVAELLANFAIPHDDGLAHHAPGPLEDAAWPAWIELQESPRIPALLRFLRAQPGRAFAGLSVAEAEDALTRTFNDLLIDDLAVVAEYLAQHPRKRHAPALAEALLALPRLPGRASIAEYAEKCAEIFRALGWDARADELARLAADWRDVPSLVVSRRAWLRWLRETLVSWRATRSESGNHPYSRVHLLPCTEAASKAWTHVIAAGLNEGVWPPSIEESGFVGEEEIDALNRRVRGLNERATTQGSQGEGHETVQTGRALCLGPAQRRDLARRQFVDAIESATVAVAATAQLFDEAAPDRLLNPGEFFTRLHFDARRRAVSQEAMSALCDETTRWLEAGALWPEPARDASIVCQTRVAFDARREAAKPFGEYEFALRTPLAPLRLAATRWESALAAPALIWMNELLGIAARDAGDETPWSLAAGQWIHSWLRAISDAPEANSFAPLPPRAEIIERVAARATAFRERVRGVLAACDAPPPDWWLSAWQQAAHIATRLAQRVGEVGARSHLATEWKFADTAIPLGEHAELHVNGRVDLILATAATTEDVWIVDYKTGNRKPLTQKKLRGGDGLQLALYALALHARGAKSVGISLLTPDLALTEPQLVLEDVAGQTRLWLGLHAMQESGVFGMRGALRDEFAFRNDYPLATLGIDEAVLDEKWERTHRDLCDGEESA